MRRPILFFIFVFLLLPATAAFCQTPDSTETINKKETAAPGGLATDRDYYATRPFDSIKSQNPTAALFKSMLVPGWGQIGNKKYIKAAIVIGGEAYFLSQLVHHAKITRDKKAAFQAEPLGSATRDRLFEEYQAARDDRNLNTWYLGTVIFISMFDAYVDAHLANFPKYDRTFSFNLEPMENTALGARLCLHF